MKKPLNFGNFRSKRLDILAKELPDGNKTYDESNGQVVRSLLRHSMKTMNNSITINTLNSRLGLSSQQKSRNNSTLNSLTKTRESTGYKHARSQSNKPHTPLDPKRMEGSNLLTPTSSSLKKLIKLNGPGKAYLKDIQTGPGPGAYHKPLSIGGVSYGIGKAKRVRERKPTSVGPGAYQALPLPAGIGYSMTPRRKPENKIFDFPGPGAYSPSESESGIKFSISKADRNRNRKIESPGPGAYSISRPSSSRSALTVKSSRPPLSQILDTPGPGKYHFELKIGGPELSIRNKFNFESKSIEPGPGTYTPNLLSQTAPGWKFGSSKKRLQFNDYSVPEPGWYNSRTVT